MAVRNELPPGLIASWPLPVITTALALTVLTVIGPGAPPAAGSKVRVPGPPTLAAMEPEGGVHCVDPRTVLEPPMLTVEVTGPGPMSWDRAATGASKPKASTVEKKYTRLEPDEANLKRQPPPM